MRVRQGPWLVCVALLLAWLIGAPSAWAAAQIMVPRGWAERGEAPPEAQRRAERWREALGLRLAQVVASREEDRFAETAAVFESASPVHEAVFASQQDALKTLSSIVAPIVGAEPPKRTELRTLNSGVQLVWAQWAQDDLIYECVLAPSGENSSVIVFSVQARDLDEQRTTIDNMIAGLEGVTAPMPAFSVNSWRMGSILTWLALALLLHAIMLTFVDRDRDHKQAGTRASAILLGLVVVGTIGSYFYIAPSEAALTYAGSTVTALVSWIGVAGLVVSGVHFLLASRYDQGVVRSAPSSGVYASGTYSSTDLIRSSITRTNMRLRAEDIAAGSGAWVRENPREASGQSPAAAESASGAPVAGASQSARIVIDDAEREG
ncbi:MAG: hypothetical protein KC431_11355 [Myxococcales bacterium]|nr:hypothetical protein [Myxococcales bacterium]